MTIVWYEGLRVRLFLGNDLSLCLYVGGSFEPNEFVLWRSVLEPGMVFVDCGANDGLHSLFAARRVGDTGRVIAVEPSSREHERLMANLRVNELENVTTARVALGASPGVATLAIAGEGHEVLNTIGVRVSNPNVEAARHERVDVRTLDDLVSTLGLGRVDVIKLDVEGSELHVLEGARSVIARHRPLLLLEVEEERLASQGTTKDLLLNAIAGLGYRLHVFDAVTGQLRPPRRADEPDGNAVASPPDWQPPVLGAEEAARSMHRLRRHRRRGYDVELLRDRTPMIDLLRERGVFERDPFVLLDVGCSGGIAPRVAPRSGRRSCATDSTPMSRPARRLEPRSRSATCTTTRDSWGFRTRIPLSSSAERTRRTGRTRTSGRV